MDAKEMIDRYVFAVGQNLPAKQRQDITQELRSSLWDSLEDRFGSDVDMEQAVLLLKEMGSPEKVAASYWPGGQYLIGPELYPLYRTILNILVAVWLIGGIAVVALGVASGEVFQPLEWLGGLLQGFVSMFGGLTFVFAILQRFGVKGEDQQEFNPLKLPKIENEDLINRRGQLVEFIVGVVVLALIAYLPSRIESFFPNAVIVRLPAVESVLGWIVVSIIISMLLNLILLVRGRWTLFTRMINIAANLFSMVIIGWILNSSYPLVSANGVSSELIELTEMGVRIGLIVALVVVVVDTALILYGIVKSYINSSHVKVLPLA